MRILFVLFSESLTYGNKMVECHISISCNKLCSIETIPPLNLNIPQKGHTVCVNGDKDK